MPNAVPTAEGAIALAMELLPITMFDSDAVVTGFGRVARRLCMALDALGVRVAVAARKTADLAEAKSMGYLPLDINTLESQDLSTFEVVYNTVPTLIVTPKVIERLQRDCVIIDLASLPGGVDFEYAKSVGVTAVQALSLPGKVAPKTAASIILETILRMISERGPRQ